MTTNFEENLMFLLPTEGNLLHTNSTKQQLTQRVSFMSLSRIYVKDEQKGEALQFVPPS